MCGGSVVLGRDDGGNREGSSAPISTVGDALADIVVVFSVFVDFAIWELVTQFWQSGRSTGVADAVGKLPTQENLTERKIEETQ